VNAVLVERAPAKINLTLHVLARRPDGYHELESLVAFADLADTLTFEPGEETGLAVTGPYAGACGAHADNLILKAFAALRERVSVLIGGRFLLEKNLPVAAGIGGGSSDAAAALRLLARANALALDDARLFSAARAVGADVPVCLDPRARIMRGIGENLSKPIVMPRMPALLANPGVPLSTRDVFAKLSLDGARTKTLTDLPSGFDGMVTFLREHGNDLTAPAIACAPIVDEMLNALNALPGARLARMSGSGSTCFALFSSEMEALAAAERMRKERSAWWIWPTTLG
jgi:4-diphosphocytidyl-2-C-methyl-D-erythritol kinase